jgi:hypothetical protein
LGVWLFFEIYIDQSKGQVNQGSKFHGRL